jgi:hypothetical protein
MAPRRHLNRTAAFSCLKKRVEEVILHATVVDEQRHLVPDLDRSAFSVFESGVHQTITSFHRDDVPVAMGIVIDNSGSMREKRDKVNEAVLNVPPSVWQLLLDRFQKAISHSDPAARFRGSLVDPRMFAIDVKEWGLADLLAEYRAFRLQNIPSFPGNGSASVAT